MNGREEGATYVVTHKASGMRTVVRFVRENDVWAEVVQAVGADKGRVWYVDSPYWEWQEVAD